VPRSDRFERLRLLQSLDPEHDFERIYRDMVLFEFSWEMVLGFNLAFIRPFAVPSISRITAATGEVTGQTRKRVDDTAILMYELYYHGFEHPRGQAVVRRLNKAHRMWRTTNDDYLYVLATLLIPPLRFADAYGWRPLCCHERRSAFLFYRELGRRMAVRDIPDTLDELVSWFDDYERRHLRFDPANAELMAAMHEFMGARVHPRLRRLVNRGVDSLLEDPVREAIGLSRPSWPVRALARSALRLRAVKVRFDPPAKTSTFVPGAAWSSYPDGYDLDEVGPPDQRELAAELLGKPVIEDQPRTSAS
jgi:hypothetical protein